MKARQNLTSFISVGGVLAVPLVERRDAVLVGQHKRQRTGVDDREAAGLIAGADIGDVGDAVARHVVVIECLAELLGGKHREVQRAARGLVDRCAPVLERLLQRMRLLAPTMRF